MFKKYTHVERFGTDETEGIEFGLCWVFPKLDGSNGSVWQEHGCIKAGSRNRELTLASDNQGFYDYILNGDKADNFKEFFKNYPELILYGEWLVPHSLRTYRDDAWRKFYIFDVFDVSINTFYAYDEYKPTLGKYSLNYIPAQSIIQNGRKEVFEREIQNNVFLIKDGQGVGEGIVIKNYDYQNKYGRNCFAKIVTNEFKEKNQKTMGATHKKFTEAVEKKIIDKFLTSALIDKTYVKIKNENNGWSQKFIPQLLGRVYHDFVTEETWQAVKEFKNPTINFKILNARIIAKTKELKPEVF